MTFSQSVKNEILESRPERRRTWNAVAYGLFSLGIAFDRDDISIITGQEDIAALYEKFAHRILGSDKHVIKDCQTRSGKKRYSVRVADESARIAILTHFGHKGSTNGGHIAQDNTGAFLSGAFLACGNMADPEKSYHLEFVTKSGLLCLELASILNECVPGVKTVTRRESFICYYKEFSQIEDILTLIGASKACLSVIDVEMIKEVRNRANRMTNCETANIDKTVTAAAGQIEDIELIISVKGLNSLPEQLRGLALLRIENPDLSLRELADLLGGGISRSGIHHRLDKLSKMADGIRESK